MVDNKDHGNNDMSNDDANMNPDVALNNEQHVEVCEVASDVHVQSHDPSPSSIQERMNENLPDPPRNDDISATTLDATNEELLYLSTIANRDADVDLIHEDNDVLLMSIANGGNGNGALSADWRNNLFHTSNVSQNEPTVNGLLSRQSTVSSIAGNSIDCADDDIVYQENAIDIIDDHALDNTKDEENKNDEADVVPYTSDIIVASQESNGTTVQPSQTELTSSVTQTNADNVNSKSELMFSGEDVREKTVKHHRHVTTAEENIAVEALASLSTNVAEMTLSEHDVSTVSVRDGIINPITQQEENRTFVGRGSDRSGFDEFASSNKNNISPFDIAHRNSSATKLYIPSSTATVGADQLVMLERIDESRFTNHTVAPPSTLSTLLGTIPNTGTTVLNGDRIDNNTLNSMRSGRRKIQFRLQEETFNSTIGKKRHVRSTSLLGTIRKSSTRMLRFSGVSTSPYDSDDFDTSLPTKFITTVDRGTITVGWFDGTSSLELQQHIRNSVLRKLQKIDATINDLDDLRILDDSFNPPEDVVLSVHIPDGSQFLLRFGTVKLNTSKNSLRTKTDYDGTTTPMSIYSGRAPDSPDSLAGASSPHLYGSMSRRLNAKQLALLSSINIPTSTQNKLQSMNIQQPNSRELKLASSDERNKEVTNTKQESQQATSNDDELANVQSNEVEKNALPHSEEASEDDADTVMFHSDDPIEARLREITNLLLLDRRKERRHRDDRQREKQQVVFVVANYFVLFLAIIAVSAELQARAPNWIKLMERHLQNVQNCSENHETLFECISRGDFAGLIASVVLWLSRSVATKRIFLFGFDTPQKLWTVVYESFITSVCWGISYLFIRRGMNPDTRPNFVHKYWKDAVYGSLAGFNAAFLKHILKNLIPEQVVQDALRERQLKIMGWLPSFKFR